jgi:type I thyroxine 5'-deiodinase
VAFYVVYIREAHPSDGWQMASNIREHIVFASPKSLGERDEVAGVCVRRLGLEIPALVDDVNDAVENAYTGWPDRLYVIGRDGRVASKSAPGPFGFDPAGVAETLARLVPGP